MSTIVDIEKGEADLLAYCERKLPVINNDVPWDGVDSVTPLPIGPEADSKQPWRSPAGPGYAQIHSKDFSPTYEVVMTAARDAFDEYAKGKTGRLYWRQRPELFHDSRGWRFYMRLLIA